MEKLFEIFPGGQSGVFRLIGVVMTVLITFTVLKVSDQALQRLERKRAGLPHKFLHSSLKGIIMVIGLFAILSQFEFTRDFSTTILQSGSLIIAVATFAAQKALGNVISGFSISASKPCDIGQKIRVVSGGTTLAEGLVRDMTMRHVVIEQYDGQACILPNSVIDSSVIVNTNYIENVGNFMEFEIAFGSDVEKAKEIIMEECRKEPLLIDVDRISVLVNRLTANGIVLKFTAKTKDLNDSFRACSNLRQHVVEAFGKNGIEIPYQTVTVLREQA